MQNAGGMRLAGQALQAAAGKQAGAGRGRQGQEQAAAGKALLLAAESCLGAVLSLLPLVVTQQRHPLMVVLTTQNRENAECGRNAASRQGQGQGKPGRLRRRLQNRCLAAICCAAATPPYALNSPL